MEGAAWGPMNGEGVANWSGKSGMGLPHSKTLARPIAPYSFENPARYLGGYAIRGAQSENRAPRC